MKLFEIMSQGFGRAAEQRWNQQGAQRAWWILYNGKNVGPFDSMDAALMYRRQKGFPSAAKVVPGTGHGPMGAAPGTNIAP